MNVADLVHLLEAITRGNSVADVRAGRILLNSADEIDDESYGTLIDFIRGERPQLEVAAELPPARPVYDADEHRARLAEQLGRKESRFAELGINPQAPGLTPEELEEERRLSASVGKFDMSGITLPTIQG